MNRLRFIFYLSIVSLLSAIFVSNSLMAQVELKEPQWIGMNKGIANIHLQWFRVQKAVAYVVERRTGEDGDFQKVAQVANPIYRDFNIAPGLVYFYRIIPLDKDGKKGKMSEIRYIEMEPLDEKIVSVPQWETQNITEEGISLAWRHDSYDDVLAYNLYRKKEGESDYSLIASSMSAVYLDRDVAKESQYSYVVTALDKKLQESDSSGVITIRYNYKLGTAPADERFSTINTIEEVVRRTELYRIYSWEDYGFLNPVDVEYDQSKDLLYVSDSSTGLITVIGSEGEVINQLGGNGSSPGEFDKLLGIAVDPGGKIYAVDAYRGNIVVFSPKGVYLKRISLENELRRYFGTDFETRYPGFRFGLVDVAVAGNGYLVVVDNPNGWIYILDEYNSMVRVIGKKGYEPGKMHYPTFVIVDSNGRLIVSDTLNARVQVFTLDGSHLEIVGEKGPGIGQFLRPKGMVADTDGNIYISDSQHNVVQVFNSNFEFISLLGDEKGLPIDLGSPNGVTFIEPDLLVICERLSRRVQIRKLFPAVPAVSTGEKVPLPGKFSLVEVGG